MKYLHIKTGRVYELICEAVREEDLVPVVVYRALYGEKQVWVRAKADFFDGRFRVFHAVESDQ